MNPASESVSFLPVEAAVSRKSQSPQGAGQNPFAELSRSCWVLWGRWMFRHRGWLFTALGGILWFQALASYGQATDPTRQSSGAVRLVWFVLVGLGVFIRLHVAGRAPPATSSRGITLEAGQLVTAGMYAYVRNPLYLANLMIWSGLALFVAPVWWVGLFIGIAAFFYHLIVLAEEDFLLGRFGQQYLQYCRATPRWIPRLPFLRRAGFFSGLRWPQTEPPFFSPRVLPEQPPLATARAIETLWPSPEMLSEEPTSGGITYSGQDRSLGVWATGDGRSSLLAPAPQPFTWRQALFREADSLMLVLLAIWALTGLTRGRLPWQLPPDSWAVFWTAGLVLTAIGWGWIKCLKKRSWPTCRPTASAAEPSEKRAWLCLLENGLECDGKENRNLCKIPSGQERYKHLIL